MVTPQIPATVPVRDGATGKTAVVDLVASIEAPSTKDYRRDVLGPLHSDRMIEYDTGRGQTVEILTPGEAVLRAS